MVTTLSTNIKERYIYSSISYRHSVVFLLGGERENTASENRGWPQTTRTFICVVGQRDTSLYISSPYPVSVFLQNTCK